MTKTKPVTALLPAEQEHYFIFVLNQCFYAVPAMLVSEVVYLPELTLLTTTPPEIAGVFDLRGTIIPAIDLNLRLKHPRKNYLISDCVVVLTLDNQQFGIIVNSIYDVTPAQIVKNDRMLYAAELNQSDSPLLAGSLKKDHLLITLLNPFELLKQDITPPLTLEHFHEHSEGFYAKAEKKDRNIFKKRADNLSHTEFSEDSSQYLALAVITIGEEYFGLELKDVHEFADVEDIVPIPGTPSHIKGCMNLRGNVVTLLDLHQILGLQNQELVPERKVVILQEKEDVALGIVVDNIIEVIYIAPNKISPVPSVVLANAQDCLSGELLYEDKLLTLINLNLLLKKI